jgi:hypothetical protein
MSSPPPARAGGRWSGRLRSSFSSPFFGYPRRPPRRALHDLRRRGLRRGSGGVLRIRPHVPPAACCTHLPGGGARGGTSAWRRCSPSARRSRCGSSSGSSCRGERLTPSGRTCAHPVWRAVVTPGPALCAPELREPVSSVRTAAARRIAPGGGVVRFTPCHGPYPAGAPGCARHRPAIRCGRTHW